MQATAEQHFALRAIAEAQDVSIAELIRRAVDLLLEQLPTEDDPATQMVSLGHSGIGNLAEKHDEYLTQFERERNRS